jgi:heat shock protein HslJ
MHCGKLRDSALVAGLLFMIAGRSGFCGAQTTPSGAPHDSSGPSSPSSPPTRSAASSPTLTETHWNLTELDGDPVNAAAPDAQPYIYLHADGDKLSGSGGCNRLFGSFDLSGSSLSFHSVASTLMACANNSMQHEPELLEALKLATGYRISGDTLQLRVDDRVLARFRAETKN